MEVEILIDTFRKVKVMFINYPAYDYNGNIDTVGTEDMEKDYKRYRDVLLEEYYTPTSDKQFIDNFPKLIEEYDTLQHLWYVLRENNKNDPRACIYSDFKPIRKYLEKKRYGQNTKKIIPLERLISNENIQNTVKEARQRIDRDKFAGAITLARTLVEGILKELYRKLKFEEPPKESKLPKLYGLIAPLLNLSPAGDLDNCLKKILSGLYLVNEGIANLRNVAGDAHAQKENSKGYKLMSHHTLLAVNCAFTFSQFLCDTYLYQKDKKDIAKSI
jgi:HEPN domain-containing protein